MSVERNEDGSITINNKNGMKAISRITKLTDDKWEEKFRQVVKEYAKLATTCAHTIKETEQYFLEQCDALPITTEDRRMKCFKLNVVLSHFRDKLENQAQEFSFDMTDEEIESCMEV